MWTDALEPDAQKRRAVLASAPVLVFAVGVDGRFSLWEGLGSTAFGLSAEEVLGHPVAELFHDVKATRADGGVISGTEIVERALRGQEFSGLCTVRDSVLDLRLAAHADEGSGEQAGVVGVAVDVTGQTRADAVVDEARDRLVVADRLAAIGTLAAGAAHEINNPLTYALINVAHVLRQLRARTAAMPPREENDETTQLTRLVRSLEQAQHGMERVREVVRNLLTFSQGTVEQSTQIDVRGVLESSIQMALHEIVHRARLIRDFGDLPPVVGNEAALGQVFLNLLVNAAQAIPEGDGRNHEVRVRASTDPDGNAVVEITDNGVGIPPEILPRIFEAFFTTRAVGGGTGLGLSISYGTVTRLGGTIEVTSEVGCGTCFRVVLPAAERWRQHPSSGKVMLRTARRRSVLVIDDDALVGEAIAEALDTEADVDVLTDGTEALARLSAGERWDVILCDLMMPGLSGMDFYAEALKTAPDAAGRIAFMTAGTFTQRARAFVQSVGEKCFDKPIDTEKLREIVRGGGR